MKYLNRICFFVALAVTATVAQAQTGCVNSPENPTALLALVGTGGFALTMLRDRWRGRNK
jgi:XrtJ-associated TM-motif-TM protein